MIGKDFCDDPTCELNRKGEKHEIHSLKKIDESRIKKLEDLVSLGSKSFGGAFGAIIGTTLAGPPGTILGSIAGTAAGHVLTNIGHEFVQRVLGKREQERLGVSLYLTAQKVDENIKKGIQIRNDDFFISREGNRSDAEEIVEGLLLTIQKEHEERKLPYYSNLLANIPFSPGIDRPHANLLINLSQRLTYRQLCLLSIFSQKEQFSLRKNDYSSEPTMNVKKVALLQEVFELDSLGLINSGSVSFGVVNVIPAKMNVEGQGQILYKLMNLSQIDKKELDEITTLLR